MMIWDTWIETFWLNLLRQVNAERNFKKNQVS